jgi:topoisomerase-4 subunit A
MKEILFVGKLTPDLIVNAVHFDGHKGWTMVKRFRVETNKTKERYSYLTDHPKSKLLFASVAPNPRIRYTMKVKGKPMPGEITLGDFMDVKGWKAVGNRLSDQLLTGIKEVTGPSEEVQALAPVASAVPEALQGSLFGEEEIAPMAPKQEGTNASKSGNKLKPGDQIEFD